MTEQTRAAGQSAQEATGRAEVDMTSLLQKILQLEGHHDESASAEKKEAEKVQKKKLREVRKLVSDAEVPVEEKIAHLMNKLMQEVKENTRQQIQTAQDTNKAERITVERDQAQSELKREGAVREKLQTLCRELQKQNKQVLDDSRGIAEREQEKRREMSDKFGETVKDISARLDEHTEERLKQAEENDHLRTQLKKMLEQVDLREEHWGKQLHAKDLEAQLAEAKLKQEQQTSLLLETKASQFAKQIELMQATEGDLRNQLESYAGKFSEFQETLTQSNEVFGSLRQDSEKQAKSVRMLEKKLKTCELDRRELKLQSEKASMALIGKMDECDVLTRKVKALEGLCRTLQQQHLKPEEATTDAKEASADAQ